MSTVRTVTMTTTTADTASTIQMSFWRSSRSFAPSPRSVATIPVHAAAAKSTKSATA